MPPRKVGPRSDLQTFAAAISSSSDPGLAAWQERGLAPPSESGSILVWSIVIVSLAIGLASGAFVWLMTWRSVSSLQRPASSGGAHMNDPAILMILGGLLALLLGGTIAFVIFQGASRIAYRSRQRPEE